MLVYLLYERNTCIRNQRSFKQAKKACPVGSVKFAHPLTTIQDVPSLVSLHVHFPFMRSIIDLLHPCDLWASPLFPPLRQPVERVHLWEVNYIYAIWRSETEQVKRIDSPSRTHLTWSHSSGTPWSSNGTSYLRYCFVSPNRCLVCLIFTVGQDTKATWRSKCHFAQVSKMPNISVKLVHKCVGQANPPIDFMEWFVVVMHCATKICEAFQNPNVLAILIKRLHSLIQLVSKYLHHGLRPGNLSSDSFRLQCNTLTANTKTSNDLARITA